MSPLGLCVWAALIGLLLTAIFPVVCFLFPGPRYMPLRYETLWALTELLWAPLRMVEANLSPIFGGDLRQHLNPCFLAPLVNAPLAFAVALGFLMLNRKWRTRLFDVDVRTDLRSVVDSIRHLRSDHAVALRQRPHPVAHPESVMQDARKKVAAHAYFQHKTDPEAEREDDQHG
jgi:hypothetical protein